MVLVAIVLAGISGCRTALPIQKSLSQPASVTFPEAFYREASAYGRVHWLDPQPSALRIYVYRPGPWLSSATIMSLWPGTFVGLCSCPAAVLVMHAWIYGCRLRA